jgi:hypothetical protein
MHGFPFKNVFKINFKPSKTAQTQIAQTANKYPLCGLILDLTTQNFQSLDIVYSPAPSYELLQ